MIRAEPPYGSLSQKSNGPDLIACLFLSATGTSQGKRERNPRPNEFRADHTAGVVNKGSLVYRLVTGSARLRLQGWIGATLVDPRSQPGVASRAASRPPPAPWPTGRSNRTGGACGGPWTRAACLSACLRLSPAPGPPGSAPSDAGTPTWRPSQPRRPTHPGTWGRPPAMAPEWKQRLPQPVEESQGVERTLTCETVEAPAGQDIKHAHPGIPEQSLDGCPVARRA